MKRTKAFLEKIFNNPNSPDKRTPAEVAALIAKEMKITDSAAIEAIEAMLRGEGVVINGVMIPLPTAQLLQEITTCDAKELMQVQAEDQMEVVEAGFEALLRGKKPVKKTLVGKLKKAKKPKPAARTSVPAPSRSPMHPTSRQSTGPYRFKG